MRFTFSLILLTGLAVVSQGSPETSQPGKPAVPVVKADAVSSFAANRLVNVVQSTTPMAGYEAPTPVSSLQEGLPYVQKTFKRPIVAMAESEGWFFYATSAFLGDEKAGEEHFFISGYAIKRGGRQVVEWSVW